MELAITASARSAVGLRLLSEDEMNTEYMLLGLYQKPRITLLEVCHAINMEIKTAYNKRAQNKFPIPMTGSPLTADIRDVARYLDILRQAENGAHGDHGSKSH